MAGIFLPIRSFFLNPRDQKEEIFLFNLGTFFRNFIQNDDKSNP